MKRDEMDEVEKSIYDEAVIACSIAVWHLLLHVSDDRILKLVRCAVRRIAAHGWYIMDGRDYSCLFSMLSAWEVSY
jgi:hypothetical protein